MLIFVISLIGTPSTIYKGFALLKVPIPLILTVGVDPGCPEVFATVTPAALPCIACAIETVCEVFISFVVTDDTEPVKSDFFTVP